ncbi:MAG: hypothetical protein WAT78_15190 [Rhizobiaceae bacterium]
MKRFTKALEMLREAELSRQAGANLKRATAAATASELDGIDLQTSSAWPLFPQNWLNFRSRLDQEIAENSAKANAAAAEALRIEKTADRIAEVVAKLDQSKARKQTELEILEYISRRASPGKPALGKFAAVSLNLLKK